MKTAPHSVYDPMSGIRISETNGKIEVSGLDIDTAKCNALGHLLDVWKYGLIGKKPRRSNNNKKT